MGSHAFQVGDESTGDAHDVSRCGTCGHRACCWWRGHRPETCLILSLRNLKDCAYDS